MIRQLAHLELSVGHVHSESCFNEHCLKCVIVSHCFVQSLKMRLSFSRPADIVKHEINLGVCSETS